MTNLKQFLLFLLPLITAFALTSCGPNSDTGSAPGQTEYKQPVSKPLVFSKPKKINWDSIKPVTVHPLVKHFDLDKLPAQRYDTAGFKPFKYPVEETHLDINTLPEKDLDIDKLQSRPLKFKTEKLPPPRLIHSGPPHLKDLNLSLFELGEQQGLKKAFVTGLLTDRDGFLWIASIEGVYRYDGENLLLYIPGPFQRAIFKMVQDDLGRIWMSTFGGGLEVFDPKEMTLKKTDKTMGLSSNLPNSILVDKQHRIWVSTWSSGGISIIDPKTQTVKWLDKAHKLSDTATSGITQDKNHNIWIAAGAHGVNIIDLENKKIKYLDKAHGLTSDSIFNVFADRSGRLWVGLVGGVLNVLDIQKNSIQTIKEAQAPKALFESLSEDNKGRVWAGDIANGGVTVIDPEKHVYKKVTKRDGLDGDEIVNITPDNQGQVWIGSAGLNMISENKTVLERVGKKQVFYLAEDHQGLVWEMRGFSGFDIIDRKSKTIRNLGVKQGLGSDTVGYVYDVQGKIYTITNAGIDIIDPQAKTMVHIGKAEGFVSGINSTFDVDKTGRIWFAGSDGLNVFDPKANTMKHIGKAQGVNGDGLANILKDGEGRIWVSSNSGVIQVIDPVGYTIQTLINNGPAFIDQGGGTLFFDDQKGNMWLGTDKGIYVASLKNKTLTAFSIPQGLVGEKVATLLGRDSQIYVSTTSGITVLTPPAEGITANNKWGIRSFGPEYGLDKLNPNFAGTDVISSDGHFLWADYGLSVLDLSKKDTTRPPAYISGMNIMDQPAIFMGRSHTVSNGQAWDGVDGPFNLPVNFKLPHDQNYMQFFYGTLNFKQRDTTWYRYRLVGADTGWSAKTNLDHSRNYFSLAPGKYTFEVVSKSTDNGWSKAASFSFIITPPWWQTWWAYLIYVFLFGGTIWAFVTYRSMQLIKEKRVLEQKVKARTEEVMQQKEEIEAQRDTLEKAFGELKSTQTQLIQSEKMASLGELTAGIAHEIQNPLNFINNFSEVNKEMLVEMKEEIAKGNIAEVQDIADSVIANEEKISHHGKRADSIVKGMLEHSRNASGQKEPTDINQLADEYLRLSYHGLRAKDKSFNAELVTNFDPALPKVNATAQDIGRVLLNLFNNAFYAVNQKSKTAGAGYKAEVSVSTSTANGQVVIKVKDNGVGIPDAVKEKIMQPFFTTKPTGEGTGLGLSLTYDMVVKGHGGSINVESVEGEGSKFTIKLPITL